MPTNKSNPAQDVATPTQRSHHHGGVEHMRPSPEVCQPQPQSTAIDRSVRFQLLSERVDTISHTGEACWKGLRAETLISGKQEDGRERDLDNVRNAVDTVQSRACVIILRLSWRV